MKRAYGLWPYLLTLSTFATRKEDFVAPDVDFVTHHFDFVSPKDEKRKN